MTFKQILCGTAVALALTAVTVAQKPVKFTSAYSSLSKACKTLSGGNGTDDASLCKGVGGYNVRVYFSAAAMHINAESRSDENTPLATLDVTFDERRTTLEWRLADGKPFAVIMRVPVYGDPKEGEYFGKVIGHQLKITGLGSFEIDQTIDAAAADANQKARDAADNAYKSSKQS